MKKRIFSLVLAAVTAMTMVVGCGTDTNPNTDADGGSTEAKQYEGVELTMWSMWNEAEAQGQVVSAAAAAFEEETGAKVNIEWKGRDISSIIMAALESGESVDIFEEDYARIAQTYASEVLDLTDMAAAANYDAQSFACFNDVATEWAGFLPCITEQPQVGGVYYNKDIFAECGVEIPTTWEEFMAACQKIKDGGYQPIALDTAYINFISGYHFDRYLTEATTTELTLNGGWSSNEDVIAAADSVIELVKAGYLADGAPDEYPAGQNKLGIDDGNGLAAMVVCANYVCAETNNNTKMDINWGCFNYPTATSGSANAYAGANSLAISKDTENAQAAFDFCLYLTSGTYDQQMADSAAQIPADPRNTAPAIMDGTIETLEATEAPLSWAMGLNQNAELKDAINDILVKLYEGAYATGADFAAAMDGLY